MYNQEHNGELGEGQDRGDHLRRIEDFYTPFVDSDRRIPRRPCVASKIILS